MPNRKYGLKGYRETVLVSVSLALVLSVFITGSFSFQVSMGKLTSPGIQSTREDCERFAENIRPGPIRDLFVANCLINLPDLNPADGTTLRDDIQRIISGVISFDR